MLFLVLASILLPQSFHALLLDACTLSSLGFEGRPPSSLHLLHRSVIGRIGAAEHLRHPWLLPPSPRALRQSLEEISMRNQPLDRCGRILAITPTQLSRAVPEKGERVGARRRLAKEGKRTSRNIEVAGHSNGNMHGTKLHEWRVEGRGCGPMQPARLESNLVGTCLTIWLAPSQGRLPSVLW